MNDNLKLLFKLSICLCAVFLLTAAPLFAQETDDKEECKIITLDYLYKKDELGIKPVDPDYPQNLQWSTEGHTLAYLVSRATEAPHMVFYNPVNDATAFLITPCALHDALIQLASKPEGVAIAPYSLVQYIPDDATEVETIDRYDWLKDEDAVRLHVKGKKYTWDLEENLLVEEEEEKTFLPAGEKNDIEYSPNERFAAYTRANDIYVYDTEQKKEIRLTHDGSESTLNGRMTWVYWEELHYRRGYRAFYWSPNSDTLAYLQFDETGVSTYPVVDYSTPVPKVRNMFYPKAGTRNPAVRVGVVSLSTRDTQWIDLREPYEYIARVAWTPDGKKLAIQALNRAQDRLTLLFADPGDGTSEIILEETDDAWVNAHGGPYFLEDDNAFLWLSERSGYRPPLPLFQRRQAGQATHRRRLGSQSKPLEHSNHYRQR